MTQFIDFNASKSVHYKRLAEELLKQKGWPRYYTMGYYTEDFGCEIFDFKIPLNEEQYNYIKSIVDECNAQDIPVSEYFCDNEAPEYIKINEPAFYCDPYEIHLDEAHYPCTIKMAIFYDGIEKAPQVIERNISLSHDDYLELLVWQLENKRASYNDLYEYRPQLFKMLNEKLRMIFSNGDIVAPIAVPMYTVELVSIKEDALALCGEPEVGCDIFYRSDEEAYEHSYINIEDRKMSFFYEYWDRKKEMTTKTLFLDDIDAVAVERALGVDSYAGIIDSLSFYFGAADGVTRFADFLRSKSIDFVEKDRY
jgi:hypothetical protein